MWIATLDGLVRYDGYTFLTYRWQHDNENSITGNNVYSLHESSTGVLWIGTAEGLTAFDPQREIFTRYVNDPDLPGSLPNNRVSDIVEDASGHIWVATSGGLAQLDPATGHISTFQHDDYDPESLTHNEISNLCIDENGILWVATYGGGLDRLDPGADRFIHYRHDPNDSGSVGSNLLEAVSCDSAGSIWVGTWGAGLNRLDDPDGDFYHYPTGNQGISSDNVKDIVRDQEGMIWVATFGGGLNLIDPATNKITHYAHIPNDDNSLGGDLVTKIYQDQSGLLWFGSEATGISTLDPYRKPFKQLRHNPNEPGSIPNGFPVALWETANGELWVGSFSDGLSYGNPAMGNFKHWRHDPADPDSLASNSVFSIHVDRAGVVWIGTFNGLDRYNPETDTFTHFAHDPNDPGSLSENTVYDILEDQQGNLWLATYHGLNRFDRETGRFTHYLHDPEDDNSLAGNNIRALYEDRAGFLWIATSGVGIDRFDPATSAFAHFRNYPHDPESLSSNTISDVLEDRQGRLWVATWGNGLNLLDRATGIAAHYHEGDGLLSNKIQGMIAEVDADGNTILWLSTSQGLSRFDPQTGQFTNFDEADGLFASGFGLRSFHQGASGRIYLGGAEGLISFLPADIRIDLFDPPVVLTRLSVNNESPVIAAGGVLSQAISQTDQIKLPSNTGSFAVEFAALDYRRPGNNLYRYRLNGFDQTWITTSSDHRIAHYTNLDPGIYVFQVTGTNYDENWSDTARELTIEIVPAWWETRYLRAGSVLLMAGVAYGMVRLRRRATERSIRYLEQVVDDRTLELKNQLSVMEQLTSNLDSDSLLSEILTLLEQLIAFDMVLVGLREGDELQVRVFDDNTGRHDFSAVRVPIDQFEGLRTVLIEEKPYLLSDLGNDLLTKEKAETLVGSELPASSWVGAPLKARGRVFGILLLGRLKPNTFDVEDVRVIEQFANNVAIALDNAQLYSQVYQSSMEEERARLARDLHDSVTQILFSANLLAEVLPKQLYSKPVEAESNLNEMRRLIHAAMAETRVLLFELRPAAVEGVPLGELLALLTESITSRSDVRFQLSLDNVPSLSPEVQTAFYRIAQEALNNVVRHSQASLVRVILQESPGDSSKSHARPRVIKLSVVDNGVGLDQSKGRRGTFGLQNMRERAAAIGAKMSITGEQDAGTRVVLTWREE